MEHQIGRLTCDSHHNFTAIQGIGCEMNCLNFYTLWRGVCADLFYISDYVFRSKFDSSKNHSDNSPTSSIDEIQGVSHLPSYRFYTLAHDHRVHDLFIKYFTKKQFIQLTQVNINTYWRNVISIFFPCHFLREDFPLVGFPLSSAFWTWIIVKGLP